MNPFSSLFSAFRPSPPTPPKPPAPPSAFQSCVAFTLGEEGGYVDNPFDKGGPTNLGITQAALAHFRGHAATPQDVFNLTVEEARRIYMANYWNPIRGDDLPPGLSLAVFDFAVNSGPSRAVKELQRCLPLTEVDGALGPRTLAAIAKANDRRTLIENYCDARRQFLRGLPNWPRFGRGWAARVDRVEEKSLTAK